MSGYASYRAGLAAEEAVARRYADAGAEVAARRWRGRSGEIDLILRHEGVVVFVEVKQSKTHAQAVEHLGRAQFARIYAAASEFLVNEPLGQNSDVRIDVALVDQMGRIDVIENAFMD